MQIRRRRGISFQERGSDGRISDDYAGNDNRRRETREHSRSDGYERFHPHPHRSMMDENDEYEVEPGHRHYNDDENRSYGMHNDRRDEIDYGNQGQYRDADYDRYAEREDRNDRSQHFRSYDGPRGGYGGGSTYDNSREGYWGRERSGVYSTDRQRPDEHGKNNNYDPRYEWYSRTSSDGERHHESIERDRRRAPLGEDKSSGRASTQRHQGIRRRRRSDSHSSEQASHGKQGFASMGGRAAHSATRRRRKTREASRRASNNR